VVCTSSGVGTLVDAAIVGGVAVLAGTLVWVRPNVVCVSIMWVVLLGSPTAAAAACREDAGNRNRGGWIVEGDTMSGGIGVFQMSRRRAGSLARLEGVDAFSWVDSSWSEAGCKESSFSSSGACPKVSSMGKFAKAVTSSSVVFQADILLIRSPR
jgi:hypothetical protein